MDAPALQGVWLTMAVPVSSSAAAATQASPSGGWISPLTVEGRPYRHANLRWSRDDWFAPDYRTARRAERRDAQEARAAAREVAARTTALVDFAKQGEALAGIAALGEEAAAREAEETQARAERVNEARRERAKLLAQARDFDKQQREIAMQNQAIALILEALA